MLFRGACAVFAYPSRRPHSNHQTQSPTQSPPVRLGARRDGPSAALESLSTIILPAPRPAPAGCPGWIHQHHLASQRYLYLYLYYICPATAGVMMRSPSQHQERTSNYHLEHSAQPQPVVLHQLADPTQAACGDFHSNSFTGHPRAFLVVVEVPPRC